MHDSTSAKTLRTIRVPRAPTGRPADAASAAGRTNGSSEVQQFMREEEYEQAAKRIARFNALHAQVGASTGLQKVVLSN